jgi:putative glutathione S-transferase
VGLLIDGRWHDRWYDTSANDGRFVRSGAQYRNFVTPSGAPGPSGVGGFTAEQGRYHLYVSLACPWSHRALLMCALKGLGGMISHSVVHWYMGRDGWTFESGEGVIPDNITGARAVYEIYAKADPNYTGRVTLPVLWDKKHGTIVSNESSEIIRMLNSAFDDLGATPGDYYPEALRAEIDTINARIYNSVNDGVYKAGFSTTQHAYDEAVRPLFKTLDWLEARLDCQRFLVGERLTEADIRLFPTLVRFDAVYVGHFKCNLRRLVDYPNLWAFTRDIYQMPGISDTVDFAHIKRHYYQSHQSVNPAGIVPEGPVLDFSEPHCRKSALRVNQGYAT